MVMKYEVNNLLVNLKLNVWLTIWARESDWFDEEHKSIWNNHG